MSHPPVELDPIIRGIAAGERQDHNIVVRNIGYQQLRENSTEIEHVLRAKSCNLGKEFQRKTRVLYKIGADELGMDLKQLGNQRT